MRAESVKKKYNSECYNEMRMKLPSLSVNEGMARAAVAAFCAQLDPTASELADIKCAVSEAVTNCIVHAYRDTVGIIYITVKLCEGGLVRIEIKDKGCGIENVELARTPLYTTDREGERSGMGFTVMESFCDKVRVFSGCKKGTTVTLFKFVKGKE
jgi:stage II sporulation protein AB (anti-sigma F factor)